MSRDRISCFLLFESRVLKIHNVHEVIFFVFYWSVKNLLTVLLLNTRVQYRRLRSRYKWKVQENLIFVLQNYAKMISRLLIA